MFAQSLESILQIIVTDWTLKSRELLSKLTENETKSFQIRGLHVSVLKKLQTSTHFITLGVFEEHRP